MAPVSRHFGEKLFTGRGIDGPERMGSRQNV